MFFFFSSRRRHTRFDCDWSSDVCSSDLERELAVRACIAAAVGGVIGARIAWLLLHPSVAGTLGGPFAFYAGGRSEERRVGKSVDLGGRRIIKKKNKRELIVLYVFIQRDS